MTTKTITSSAERCAKPEGLSSPLYNALPPQVRAGVRMDVDGYYYYWPGTGGGSYAPHNLREIADALDELNKPWDDEIQSSTWI